MRVSSAAALGLALLLAGAAPPPRDIAARLPDGRTINLWCAGSGSPAILLEAGWSADSRAWARVMGPLSQLSRTCAYDRAGAGRSSAGPLPRDGRAIARDLAHALQSARIAPPYLLVGHSAGGLYIRQFAIDRPREVVGMVLVDSTVPHQPQRFERVAGPGAGSVKPFIDRATRCLEAARAGPLDPADPALEPCRTDPAERAAERWEARLSEIETLFGPTSDAIETAPTAPADAPVILLTAGRSYPEGAARDFWHGLHREIAARFLNGEARLVEASGHMMMFDAPEAIVEAVGDVLRRSRETAGRARGGCSHGAAA
jgi:pimeloyl-ACP methyl ester carboxylesterase